MFLSSGGIWVVLAVVALATISIYSMLGLYCPPFLSLPSQTIRNSALGAAISSAVLLGAAYIGSAPIHYLVPLIYATIFFISTAGVRLVLRSICFNGMLSNAQPIAIFGTGDAGQQLNEALSRTHKYVPLAFIDDSRSQQGTKVGGLNAYTPDQMRYFLDTIPINAVILAVPSASRARRREIVSKLEPLGLEVRTIPAANEIRTDHKCDYNVRRVIPEDLFGRPPAPPRDELMRQNITGKIVLVSGAGGSIGGELCRQIIEYDPAALILFENREDPLDRIMTELRAVLAQNGKTIPIEPVLGSVQDPGRVSATLRLHRPETIYHAAAYKDVALIEANVVEATLNNVFGTKVLAEAASSLGVKNFVLISTDEAGQPCNIMAASKRMAELICQGLAEKTSQTVFTIVRMGDVLPSTGSTITRIRDEIERGGPVTIKHPDYKQFFMPASEAAQLVIQAGAISEGGEVFVIDMGESIKILEVAKTMIRLRGLQPLINENLELHEATHGQIEIQILGLENGESIHSEPLYGNDPEGTLHPRILKATEPCLSSQDLERTLVGLDRACDRFDVDGIRKLLIAIPLGYATPDAALPDVIWSQKRNSISKKTRFPKLVIVKDDE